TEEDVTELFDRFVEIRKSVEEGAPLPLDLNGWTFNGYKTAIAKSLTDEELAELRAKVSRVLRSNVYESTKRQYVDALEFIERVRADE
ncbi:hypothetical protein, partial [Streptomyces scabiei]